MIIIGHFEPMENITVNAWCNMTIDHHQPMVNEIRNLDVKTFGIVKVTTDRMALTELQGSTLTVRSGAIVSHVCLSVLSDGPH